MALTCVRCGASFPARQVLEGRARHFHGRRFCLTCRPYRPRRDSRVATPRPVRQKTCESCGAFFLAKQAIDGKARSLYGRRFCLTCSPFGAHNTSKTPPAISSALWPTARRRRIASIVRYQRKRRRRFKERLVALRGGRCEDCQYDRCLAALEFHHREAGDKLFRVGGFTGSWNRLLAEADKCILVCANCHRLRHAADGQDSGHPVVRHRRARKERAVAFMGGRCQLCGRNGAPTVFDFHHINANSKSFGVSEEGIPRSWDKIEAELRKCVMLCANCHREVHGGLRALSDQH